MRAARSAWGCALLAGAAIGCASSAEPAELTLIASAPRDPSSHPVTLATGLAEVIDASAHDDGSGIRTRLTVRAEDGEIVVLDVPGGVIGDRARVVGDQLPPRVGDRVEIARGESGAELVR